MILKGNILITTDSNILLETLNMRPDVRIINLDESHELKIDPRCYIPGSILLPPVEATIAEVDGNEAKYDCIYFNHLSSDYVREYMASIIAFLYAGGKLLLYYPNSEYNNTLKKLVYFIMNIYGIHIGIIGDPNESVCFFDENAEYIQLDLIYFYTGIIGWKEYLYCYPIGLVIPDFIMNILLNQIKPYGETFEQKLEVIQKLRIGLKNNKNMINPIQSIN